MFNRAESPTASAAVIKRLERDSEGRWDAFVTGAPQATLFHLSKWRTIIESGLGHRCHYLYAQHAGEVSGVLPLAEIRSRLFGHALISTPFCVYGGAVARNSETETQLEQAAARLGEELRVDYVELRKRKAGSASWPVKELYVSFRKRIASDHAANLQAIPRKQRAMVRKGRDAGLQARHDGNLDVFYRVYAESVRNLGTPVLAKDYYANLKQAFGSDCEITIISHQRQAVAAVMSFYFRDEVHPYYGGSVARGRDLKANDYMYWALMQHAVERGSRLFDFGRSKRDSGSYHFKKHWGFEPEPLPYAYHLVRAKNIPNIGPTNRKYSLFIKTWQRLPLRVSCALGPWLARDLG